LTQPSHHRVRIPQHRARGGHQRSIASDQRVPRLRRAGLVADRQGTPHRAPHPVADPPRLVAKRGASPASNNLLETYRDQDPLRSSVSTPRSDLGDAALRTSPDARWPRRLTCDRARGHTHAEDFPQAEDHFAREESRHREGGRQFANHPPPLGVEPAARVESFRGHECQAVADKGVQDAHADVFTQAEQTPGFVPR